MAKILGLDLGTNSIGWAITENDSGKFQLLDKGVRIFSEGVKSEKGIESSRASERTGYRSARRIKFRRKLRKFETLKVLIENGMCPLTMDDLMNWRKSGFKKYPTHIDFLNWLKTDDDKGINPYFFRSEAATKKIRGFDLGRAFYHIAQRRGFLSGRLDQSAENIIEETRPTFENIIDSAQNISELQLDFEQMIQVGGDLDDGEKKINSLVKNGILKIIKENSKDFELTKTKIIERLDKAESDNIGVVKKDINKLSDSIREAGFITLGQYFNSIYDGKNRIRNHYTAREEHYLAEFDVICKRQGIEGVDEKEKLKEKKYTGLAEKLYKAIFFQRPLKSQKSSIGKCAFEKTKSRCAVSHPDFEEYRMWTFLNTIKIKMPEDEKLRFLSPEEKDNIVPKFYRKKENFNFDDLAKVLIPSGKKYCYYKNKEKRGEDYLFNYNATDTVSGCPTSTTLKNVFGDNWNLLEIEYSTKNGKGDLVKRRVNYLDFWHILSVSDSQDFLLQYGIEKLNLDEKKAKSFSKIKLKKDFASLSLSSIHKILPHLKEGLLYSHAVILANISNVIDKVHWENLETRDEIIKAIHEIVDNHSYQNGLLEIVNGMIKEFKDEGFQLSEKANSQYKMELREKILKFITVKEWTDAHESSVNELFDLFKTQMNKNHQKGEFLKINRLDEKVHNFLLGQNSTGEVYCSDANRIKKLYHPSALEKFRPVVSKDQSNNEFLILPSPMSNSIKNPMAMRSLHQLRKLVNTLIFDGSIDGNTRIHIELARELNDGNKRSAIKTYQDGLKKEREVNRKKIIELYEGETGKTIEPTEDDLLRYQLWKEQNCKEIYEDEGRNISISDIIGENPKYDIEHTLPRSVSQDNSQMNKTLCSQKFNRDIKKNKMPYELGDDKMVQIEQRIRHWKNEYLKLEGEINHLAKASKNAATKELKDKKIRARHVLKMKYDYFKGKHDRFLMKEIKPGFKNSQITDTGLITKYAQTYLKSVFKRVDSIKGEMVAEFRKAWGLQESYFDKNNQKHYLPKDRSKHTHHTIDAITIACITKDKYDVLARAWDLEDDTEKENYKQVKKELAESKPWSTFTEDLKKLEDEILVSHHTPNNLKKQSNKIVRIKGRKQYIPIYEKDSDGKRIIKTDANNKIVYKLDEKGERIPIRKKNDTVRGSLHQDTYYGAIKNPMNQDEIKYVIRKDLESLKSNDIQNIVDESVKEKIKNAHETGILVFSSNPQQKNKLNGKVWMNEQKGIVINKVRLFALTVKNPLEVKGHMPVSKSRQLHKQKVYAQNDENFALAIYEGTDKKGKIKRTFESVNNIEAGEYYKLSNKDFSRDHAIVPNPHDKSGLPLKYILKKGLVVIFFKDFPEEIKDLDQIELNRRIYKLAKFDAQGRLSFRPHFEARQASELKEVYSIDLNKSFEQVRLQVSKLDIIVEGYEFQISPTGKITWLNF
ncbi:MAG: type II CRISPR RNA-guided endonuclease Cas9 [Crocinitomicaceae bacterium]|nr:type II CRISPR RNA-guided endonuclease Cas9 [Crocinitomicaceae bacterium]